MTTVSALDQHAAAYRDVSGELNQRLFSRTACQLVDRFVRAGSAAHLGLGDAMVARRLAQRCEQVTVVEGSAELVAGASLPSNVTVVTSFFEDFVPPRPFDQLIAIHVLEHVDDPAVVLARIRDWINPGGRLLITVPNAGSIHRRIGVELGMLERTDQLNEGDHALGHHRVYDAAGFHDDLVNAGWRIDRAGGFHLKMVSNAQMAQWDDALLSAAFEVSLGLPQEICADLWAECSLP
ncbi:MAG: class SAM-dependent methyltransferase [Acidimicrobiia bacterium]|nr:class SAM-dependent methyltransferase [Acidimicrobiia bacterium]